MVMIFLVILVSYLLFLGLLLVGKLCLILLLQKHHYDETSRIP